MPTVISISKTAWVVDDQDARHKPFTRVEVSPSLLGKLVAQRHIYEQSDLIDKIGRIWPAPTLRQLARNLGLVPPEDITELRAALIAWVGSPEAPKVKTVLTPEPTPPIVAEPVTLDEPSEPLVPAASIKDEAWDRLRAAFIAQDFRETRSALAALSDDPTPSKAADLWPKVEQLLRERNMITDADL
jgi:hypothetical protein